ncbi:MAG: hypothetical protein R3A80_03690 [Bdellovibrionota bacterium]
MSVSVNVSNDNIKKEEITQMPYKKNIKQEETTDLKKTCSLVDHIQEEEHANIKVLIEKLCKELSLENDPNAADIFILMDKVNTRIKLEKELLFPLIRKWMANKELTLQSHNLLSRIMNSKYSNAWSEIQNQSEKVLEGLSDSKYEKAIERLSAEITWYAKIEENKLIPTLKKLLGLDTQN